MVDEKIFRPIPVDAKPKADNPPFVITEPKPIQQKPLTPMQSIPLAHEPILPTGSPRNRTIQQPVNQNRVQTPTEQNRNVGEPKKDVKLVWAPAEQIMTIKLLEQILEQLKKLNERP